MPFIVTQPEEAINNDPIIQHYGGGVDTDKAFNNTVGVDYGKIITNATTDVSTSITVPGGKEVRLYLSTGASFNVYGFSYDSTGATIEPFRAVELFETKLVSYSFVTPANATSIRLYTKYSGVDWASVLRVESGTETLYSLKAPYTPEMFTGTDTIKIQSALDYAATQPVKTVHTENNYIITSALLIPSGVTWVHNGHIRMASGMRDNFVRNKGIGFPQSISATADKDFHLKGHGTFEGSADSWGGDDPYGNQTNSWRSIGVLFGNAEYFSIDGIRIKESHAWGICMEQCRFGYVGNIRFDQLGAHPNQDGIDIRRGSHHITVENISGTTHDDMIALTNLQIRNDINILGTTIYEPERTNLNIHDIIIRNVNRKISNIFANITPTHYGGGLLLLCEDGLKIHDVTIDGITNHQQIHVGFTTINYSVTTQATVNDMYNISISNTGPAPIYLNRPIKHSSFINCARMDVNGTYNALVPKVGSLNLTRKYHDGDFEFFATVAA